MEENKETYTTVDEYIAQFAPDLQGQLQELRRFIKDLVPEATEKISYRMPTFVWHGNLVYFAAFKNHIGFYPCPSGIENFKEKLAVYKSSKGAVQFPLNQPLPYDLIGEIVRFRAAENKRLADSQPSKKKK